MLYKTVFSFVIIFMLFLPWSCQKVIKKAGIPEKITILKKEGISVRQAADSNAPVITSVFYKYQYQVIDGLPAWYKIKLPGGEYGWICANPAENWTEQQENKVKILLKGGISLREEPYNKDSKITGVAAEQYTFDILETDYSHFKISLPDNKAGWIYAGKPGDPWVEFAQN